MRVIPAINPYASVYPLERGEVFTTPEFVFTYSTEGAGQGSRNLQDWMRKYQLKNGTGDRMTLLNNWENTAFNFDQDLLAELMREAKDLGVDLFLLDDGWFGNKYPRKDDKAGLGDWEATQGKLPGGVPALVESAKQAGVKFGIWIEPEMVNPKSRTVREASRLGDPLSEQGDVLLSQSVGIGLEQSRSTGLCIWRGRQADERKSGVGVL